VKIPASILIAAIAPATLFPQETPVDTLADPVIAVVLGEELTTADGNRLSQLIFKPLLDRFAEENNLEPTTAELDSFSVRMRALQRTEMERMKGVLDSMRGKLKSPSLAVEERAGVENEIASLEAMLQSFGEQEKLRREGDETTLREEREGGRMFVRAWKTNHALHAKYGGRVIFQQFGPEPLDAFRDFLKDEEKNGSFRIIDTAWSERFWRYFVNESMHSFYPKEKGDELMKTPWWMQDLSDIK